MSTQDPDGQGLDFHLHAARDKYGAKPHYTMKDSSYFGSPLKDVDDNHIVLIDGHGGDRIDRIQARQSAYQGMTQRQRDASKLTAEQLAERLEKDGLPKTHKTIRLLACYGGGSTLKGRDGNYLPAIQHNNHQNHAYAQRLARALHARGYTNIVVGGYPGSVHIRDANSKKAVAAQQDGGTYLIDSDSLCLYYNGQGARVPNPAQSQQEPG